MRGIFLTLILYDNDKIDFLRSNWKVIDKWLSEREYIDEESDGGEPYYGDPC
jgi:hypothetical protein